MAIREASNRDYRSFHSVSGGHDHLPRDKGRLQLLKFCELFSYNGVALNDGRHRSPLIAHFKIRSSVREFAVTVNHLARGNSSLRQTQARGLRGWGRGQTLPIIGIVISILIMIFTPTKAIEPSTSS